MRLWLKIVIHLQVQQSAHLHHLQPQNISVSADGLVALDKIPYPCLANRLFTRGEKQGREGPSPPILIQLSLVRGASCASWIEWCSTVMQTGRLDMMIEWIHYNHRMTLRQPGRIGSLANWTEIHQPAPTCVYTHMLAHTHILYALLAHMHIQTCMDAHRHTCRYSTNAMIAPECTQQGGAL